MAAFESATTRFFDGRPASPAIASGIMIVAMHSSTASRTAPSTLDDRPRFCLAFAFGAFGPTAAANAGAPCELGTT